MHRHSQFFNIILKVIFQVHVFSLKFLAMFCYDLLQFTGHCSPRDEEFVYKY